MIVKTYGLSIFAFLVALFIYFDAYKTKNQFISNKIFMTMVTASLLILLVDMFSIMFDGKTGELYLLLNTLFNLLLFILGIVPCLLWWAYADFQIFRSITRIKKLIYILLAIFALNAILSTLSVFTGDFFSIDAHNIYHRGPYFGIYVLLCYTPFMYASVLVVINKKIINKKYYPSLLLFPLPQAVGALLQVLHYGILLTCPSMVLSLLIIYLSIQEAGLNTDYLTGVFNRRSFNIYLSDKIKSSSKNKSFSVILIDMDNFKKINDRLGHQIGDEALLDTVELLQSCLTRKDMIARFGGDEFYILLEIDQKDELTEVVKRITKAKDDFNRSGRKPYQIHFSMGYDVYDHINKISPDEFMYHIDRLMYMQKASNRHIPPNSNATAQ